MGFSISKVQSIDEKCTCADVRMYIKMRLVLRTYASGCDLIFKECNDYENGNTLVV